MPVWSYHCQSFTAGCRCCLTVTDGDEQKQFFQGSWGKNLLDGCLLQIVNDRCWLMKIPMKTGENKELLRKALPCMWLLHPHRTVKRRPFSPAFPLVESIAKAFCWLFLWDSKEKSINPFLWCSLLFWNGLRLCCCVACNYFKLLKYFCNLKIVK